MHAPPSPGLSVSGCHKPNRFFNGQSANISKSGAYVKVPMTAPLERGATVELNFPRTPTLAEQKGQFARIKRGTVVRIDREKRPGRRLHWCRRDLQLDQPNNNTPAPNLTKAEREGQRKSRKPVTPSVTGFHFIDDAS